MIKSANLYDPFGLPVAACVRSATLEGSGSSSPSFTTSILSPFLLHSLIDVRWVDIDPLCKSKEAGGVEMTDEVVDEEG